MSKAIQVDFLMAGVTDSSGEPLAGGKVYTYAAGTLTPVSMYTDQSKDINATNPIVLDARGRAQVFGDRSYYISVTNSADVLQFSIDGVNYAKDDLIVWCGDAFAGGGASNFFNVAPTPSIATVEDGTIFSFVAKHNSTGATPTLGMFSVSGIMQRGLFLNDGVTYMSLGSMLSGSLYHVQYIGGAYDHYRLLNPSKIFTASPPDYTLTAHTTRKTLNPATATAQQCADSINTMMTDLITLGLFT